LWHVLWYLDNLLYICVTWSWRIYDCSIYVLINRVWHAATGHRGEYPSGHPLPLQPRGKLLCHPLNLSSPTSLPSSSSHRQSCSPRESHPPPVLLPNQGYPKVRHDPLNLRSTSTLAPGDPLRRNATVLLPVLCFPSGQGLHCFNSKGSRVLLQKVWAFQICFSEFENS
jgi:hypothetical protein